MEDAARHPNTVAVVAAAAALGLEVVPVEHAEGTRTAQDAADAIGCDVSQIVKSLIFGVGDGELVLALVSGTNQLDERKLARAAGASGRARRVDADAVRAATGFPIGGVPPFGHRQPLSCYVDADLLTHNVVWAAAGTPHTVFAVDPSALVAAIGGTVSDLRKAAPPA